MVTIPETALTNTKEYKPSPTFKQTIKHVTVKILLNKLHSCKSTKSSNAEIIPFNGINGKETMLNDDAITYNTLNFSISSSVNRW